MFLIRGFSALLDRVFSVLGALAFCQIPGLMQRYLDALAGVLLEARRNLEVFQGQAQLAGRDLASFIQKHLASSDPDFQASGRAMQAALDRLQDYEIAYRSISEAAIWERPFVFLYHLDYALLSVLDFRLNLPLNLEGAVYALLGVLCGLAFYHGVLLLPIYIFRENDRKKR